VVQRPSLAAAPADPEIRPLLSASAASIISFSCLCSTPFSTTVGLAAIWDGCRLSQVSSTEKVSPSLSMTARSTTFCSSRTLPGQPYAWNSLRVLLSIALNFFHSLFSKAINEVLDEQGKVSRTLAQGGHLNGHNIQSVQEILAKLAFGHERV
jgi:hypothetical protein